MTVKFTPEWIANLRNDPELWNTFYEARETAVRGYMQNIYGFTRR